MRSATVIGIVLVIFGNRRISLGGFSFTHEKKDVDVGPIQISHEQKKGVPIPPPLSGMAFDLGVG